MIADYLGMYKPDLIDEKEAQYEKHLKYKPELFDKAKDLTTEDMNQVLIIIDTFKKD